MNMKILLPTLLLWLALTTPAFANTENTKTDMSNMTTAEHRKAVDECVEAKIRAKLLDAGIVTKSTTTTVVTPASAAIFTSTTPQIAYNSENGVVTLNGTVLSTEQEQRIVNLVDDIKGVQRVNSNLRFTETSGSSTNTSSSKYSDERASNQNPYVQCFTKANGEYPDSLQTTWWIFKSNFSDSKIGLERFFHYYIVLRYKYVFI
jgi:hypothetical protein